MVGFVKNTIFTLLSRFSQLILGVGASVIIARVLGPEGKGVYSLAVLLPILLITFTQFGVGPATVFYIGQKKYSPKDVLGINIIFSIIISSVATLIGLIIVLFFSEDLFPGVAQEYLILALSLIPLQLFSVFVIDVLLGLQDIRNYNLVQLIRSGIFLFLIIIFLLGLKFGISGAIFAETLSFLIGCIILFVYVKKKIGGVRFSFKRAILKDFISYGSKSYLGSIATYLYLRIDIWMINLFLNPIAVGFYAVAVGLAEKIWLISKSAGTVLFPRVASERDVKRLKEFTPIVCRNIFFITAFVALLLFILGPWLIVLFYSNNFMESVIPFQVLLIGSIAIGGSRILTNDISGRGKPMINTYVAIISLVLNLLLNIILIPKFGIVGAAWASTASYALMFFLKVLIYAKVSGNKILDIVLIKKSDFKYYKNFLFLFKNRYLNSKNNL